MNHFLNDKFDRRVFIKGLGWISAGLLFATLGGCETLLEQIKNRPTRRRLRTGSPEVDAVIETLKQGVTLMNGLPSSDRSEEHTSELQSRGLISYAVFC